MKKRYITLTLLNSVIKQEVLDKINSSSREELKDEHGRTQQDYVNLDVKVPDFFKTKNIDPNEEFEKIENYDTIPLILKLQPDLIDFFTESDDDELGSKVHYNSNYVLDVQESPFEIEEIIKQFDIINN